MAAVDGPTAPQVAFNTFLTALDTLAVALPAKLDRSVFGSQSGSTQGEILAALRFLGLTDPGGQTQPELRRLLDAPSRKTALRDPVERAYAGVLSHIAALTPQQLKDEIGAYGPGLGSNVTKDKAVRFFLQAAVYCDIEVPATLLGNLKLRGRLKAEAGEGGGTPIAAPKRRASRRRQTQNGTASATAPAPSEASPGKTIELANGGGTVTLTVRLNPLTLEKRDRDWVFDLIDQMNAYERKADGELPNVGER